MPLERAQIIERLERDRAAHVTGPPATEEELRRAEEALGHALPAGFRAVLGRLGGGLYYGAHEIFGPRRVVIHDIELVADLLSVTRRLRRERPEDVPEHAIVFHRVGGLFHLMDLRGERGSGPAIYARDRKTEYSDFESFVERVVLPAAGAGA